MKNLTKLALAILGVLIGCTTTKAQTIDIGPNEYAFQFTGNPNFGLFFNQTDGRYEFLNGSADPVIGFSATTGNFTTDLGFETGSDLVIGNNRYAFRAAANPNFGLFFSTGPAEYQLLDGSASPVFSVNANTGNSVLSGGLRLGNSSVNQAGNIRWNGSDFQGYTGSSWATLTGGSVGPAGPQGPEGPQGPQGPPGLLQDGVINNIPYYNGSDWVTTSNFLQTSGTSLGLGIGAPTFCKLFVQGTTENTQRNTIYAQKFHSFTDPISLTSWASLESSGAVTGWQNRGISYSASIQGFTFFDQDNCAAVIGSDIDGTVFGGLAYVAPGGEAKAGYFNGDVEMTGNLDVAERVSVAKSSSDSIGVSLENTGNYYRSNNWVFGESDGAGPAISNDFVISAFGIQEYIFWQTYFIPVQDNSNTLGRSSNRWSTIFSSNGTINTSDAREKKNIKELDYGLETLMELKPVSYEWKDDVSNMGTKLGFVAQDLLEIVPEVVVTQEPVENRETGEVTYQDAERMGVFYDDLIPVLTKAIQEQQGTIEELTEENEILQDQLKDVLDRMILFEQDLQKCCFSTQGKSEMRTNSNFGQDAELGQNIPNPFSESTVIRYYLPEGTTKAIIRVTDMGGSPVEDIQLGSQRGANQVEFQTQGLAAGTYLYSLFVDGKFVDTKRMVIAK